MLRIAPPAEADPLAPQAALLLGLSVSFVLSFRQISSIAASP